MTRLIMYQGSLSSNASNIRSYKSPLILKPYKYVFVEHCIWLQSGGCAGLCLYTTYNKHVTTYNLTPKWTKGRTDKYLYTLQFCRQITKTSFHTRQPIRTLLICSCHIPMINTSYTYICMGIHIQ